MEHIALSPALISARRSRTLLPYLQPPRPSHGGARSNRAASRCCTSIASRLFFPRGSMPSFFSSGNIGVEKHPSSLLASHGFLREVVPKERPFSRILISSRIPSLLSASYLICRDMDNSRLLIAHDSGGRALGCDDAFNLSGFSIRLSNVC